MHHKMKPTQFIHLCALAGVVFATSAEASSYSDTILADNPVAYWRLGELSGTTAASQVNSPANNGTYQVGFTLGQAGVLPFDSNTAVRFNGGTTTLGQSGGRMEATLATLGGTYSFDGWFNYNSSTASRGVVGAVGSRGNTSGYDAVQVNGNATGVGAPGVVTVYNGTSFTNTTSQTVSNRWYYMAFVRSGSSVSLYLRDLNGLSENLNATLAATFGASTEIDVGQRSDNFWSFPGRIDEFAVYNYALTPSQVQAHFNAVPEAETAIFLGMGSLLLLARRRTG